MENPPLELPFLKNVGLVVTYRCQVACPHCIIEAGPHRTEEMRLNDAFSWTRQIADYRGGHTQILSLTGGEPFYDLELLREISAFADARGLLVTVVTNGFWAESAGAALGVLRGVPAVRAMALSTDEYHQIHIPLDRIKNAVFAARECGVPFNVNVCTPDPKAPAFLAIRDELLGFVDADDLNTTVTFPVGRAGRELPDLSYETSADVPRSACSVGGSPIIFPNGDVIACIGPVITLRPPHPLWLGNVRERPLDEILDAAEENAVLHAIRVWGPRRLVAEVQAAGLGGYLPEEYVSNSICHLCHYLMSHERIRAFLEELTADADFVEDVAYARIHYLDEYRMVELAGLGLVAGGGGGAGRSGRADVASFRAKRPGGRRY
ncbi:MAG: radical SAM protein [Candidatus Zixiibacteriota bacterium]|jgi:MoaA/NifB/PqqE/SkfB family radical SAM enzyme